MWSTSLKHRSSRRLAPVVFVPGTALCLMLQACGGGGGSSATGQATQGPPVVSPTPTPTPSPTPTPTPTNHPPSITGTPSAAAQVGQLYTFTPTAADADGDTLSFSVSNKPTWATFSTATGKLSGTPTSMGAFADILITVSDGTASASLPAFSLTVNSQPTTTGSATLSWTPPTQRTDSAPLTNLAGYKIRYGTSPGTFPSVINVQNPGLSTYVIDGLTTGTYYFVVTAYDSAGAESAYSTAVSKTIS